MAGFRHRAIVLAGFCAIAWSSAATAAHWNTLASETLPLDAAVAGKIHGIIYVAGGYNSSAPSAALQAYDPATNTWTTLASMPAARFYASAGVMKDRLFIAGGQNSLTVNTGTETLFVYDPHSNTWAQKASMPQPSAEGIAGVIGNKLYVQAACSTDGKCDGTAFDVYDRATDTWTALANAPVATTNGSSTVIKGKLYTATYTLVGGTPTSNTEVYDPASNTWTQFANMPTPVTVAAGVHLGDEFFVFGGLAGGCPLALVQVYNPKNHHWRAYTPSMPFGLSYESAAVADGMVYVQGSSGQGGCSVQRRQREQSGPGAIRQAA
jgi:N-acetylneuraminic acid mutarotase